MCDKTRHLCVRALRTHTYRGGIKDFRDESHEFPGSIGPHRRCATTDGVGGKCRSRGRLHQRARASWPVVRTQ